MLVFRFVTWFTRAACRSGAPRPLRAPKRSAGIPIGSSWLLTSERQQDRARGFAGMAPRRLALYEAGVEAAHSTLDETRPHALVDAADFRPLHDQRSQRAGGGLQDCGVVLDREQRGLKAERAERVTDALQTCADVSRGLQTGSRSEAAPEILSRFAEGFLSAARGKLADQETDQFCEPAVGELDCFQFGRDPVDVCRAPGAGSAAAAASLRRDGEEAGLCQPVETVARDVAVDDERQRDLVSGKRFLLGACVQEYPAKLGIAGRCESVERHSGEKLPVGQMRELARRPRQPRNEQRWARRCGGPRPCTC